MKYKDTIFKLAVGTMVFFPRISLASNTSACEGAKAVGGDCSGTGLTTSIGNIIKTIFGLISVIAVIVILISAIRFITSTGDAKRIQSARESLLYAVIGLIVAILAYAIVGFVIKSIG